MGNVFDQSDSGDAKFSPSVAFLSSAEFACHELGSRAAFRCSILLFIHFMMVVMSVDRKCVPRRHVLT